MKHVERIEPLVKQETMRPGLLSRSRKLVFASMCVAVFASACGGGDGESTSPTDTPTPPTTRTEGPASTGGTTSAGGTSSTGGTTSAGGATPANPAYKLIYDINYESGTIQSGYPGLVTTHATAADASYIVNEARSGKHAVAHKVTLDNDGYFSDGSWRSETADLGIKEPNLFQIGDHHRYEFSILLKDWEPWVSGMTGSAGDIIWQAKQSTAGPSFYVMTKRNSIALRDTIRGTQFEVLSEFRPYINKWIDIRIDVRWEERATGYYKVSIKLPGEQDYKLMVNEENIITFDTENTSAYQGYIKWGLYRPASFIANSDPATRIIYHDDLRLYDLATKK